MYRRLTVLSCVALIGLGLFQAQARTIMAQKINCTFRQQKEFCRSEKGRILNGKVAVKRDDGSISSIVSFKKGYRDGETLQLNNQGKVVERIIFKEGIHEGLTEYYHANGKIWIAAPYTDGLLNGTVDVRDAKGKRRGMFVYKEGELKRGYCNRSGRKIKYPNQESVVDFNKLVTCGIR